ncbi:HDOD domain-containing protein [Exilibacterium tricleocarpae]|uniref:HDOD domain-containing protein n=2 Tax=Exilibacterium tricleocarpae TaxID=2591008 RepID=A0A545TVZ5_9GAMM|nr:HDOD domain-containing protein [Exilibacterium tricleocarpae]
MPVLAQVVRELNELTGSDEAEVNQLADVILKDANLTSQVLRIANSVQYNPSNFPINTVSRAIVLIGFTGVRATCISLMVIDSLLGKEPRERLLAGMARGFHAAAQAKNLVRRAGRQVQEEVFIAALLYHLGEMCFWACGAQFADQLDSEVPAGQMPDDEATEAVLGTSFRAITRGLARVWKLGDTLEQALYPPKSVSAKIMAVRLGDQISQQALYGWHSAEMTATLQKVANYAGIDLEQARKMVMAVAGEAAAVAVSYGASRVCHLIPTVELSDPPAARTRIEADPQLQLNILRELSNALAEGLDVNTVFQMVLEGMHRGIGLERVMVGFFQRQRIKARYVLGEGTESWRQKFDFPIDKQVENIFTDVIDTGEAQWINRRPDRQSRHLYSTDMLRLIGCRPALLSVVRIANRDVALFYADRGDGGGQLDKDQFASFRHFTLQTGISLGMLTQKDA